MEVKTKPWSMGRDQAFVDAVGLAIAERDYKIKGFAPPPWYGVTSECPEDRQPLSLQERCQYSAMAVAAMEVIEAFCEPDLLIGDELRSRAANLERYPFESATMAEAGRLAANELRQVALMVAGMAV